MTSSFCCIPLSLKAAHKWLKSILWQINPFICCGIFLHSKITKAYGSVLLEAATFPFSIVANGVNSITLQGSPSITPHSLSFRIESILFFNLKVDLNNGAKRKTKPYFLNGRKK